MTTKREYEQRAQYYQALQSLGFTHAECEQLRRISMTLHRWHELECGDGNGCIERDEHSGIPQWRYANDTGKYCGYPIPDREKGALKRLDAIVSACNKRRVSPGSSHTALGYFVQTDPRGAALYILRPGDVPAGESAEAYYNRGICVF